jgi:hypothetical protein
VNWDSDELRAAALRLLLSGSTKSSKAAEPMLGELEELGLVTPAPRQGEFLLQRRHTEKLRHYLVARWPQLGEAESAFAAQPDMISAASLRALRRLPLQLPHGIDKLNRKTWSAWAGAHSKSGFRGPPDSIVLTSDEGLRLRPNAGLQIIGDNGLSLPIDAMQALFGEVMVPERAFARKWRVSGVLPKLVLTVENIGAFVDLPAPPWLLVLHAPGRNTALATRFVARLPAHIPWAHFGDLDPAGLDIAMSIRAHGHGRRPVPWIPRAAAALLETHGLPLGSPWPERDWPKSVEENPVLQWLSKRQRWLEHEAVVLLPGIVEELEDLVRRCSCTDPD